MAYNVELTDTCTDSWRNLGCRRESLGADWSSFRLHAASCHRPVIQGHSFVGGHELTAVTQWLIDENEIGQHCILCNTGQAPASPVRVISVTAEISAVSPAMLA